MNLDAIDTQFLADCLGHTPGRDEVREVRAILCLWATCEQYRASRSPLSKTRARARKMAGYAHKLREAIDEFDLPLPPLPNLRVPLWQIESTCRSIDRTGDGRQAGKGPNWPLGLAVEALVQFFHDHGVSGNAPAVDNRAACNGFVTACDDFVYETLKRSKVKVAEGPVRDPKDALFRDYVRRTHRNKSTGRWEWNPRGLSSS